MCHFTTSIIRIFLIIALLFITACGGSGGGGGTISLPPDAPTGLDALAGAGDGTVTVEWTAGSGAVTYNLYWSAGTTIDTATADVLSNVSSPQVFSDLPDDQNYAYLVTAVNGSGESDPSVVAMATTRAPWVRGQVTLPDLYVTPGGGFNAVCMYNLSWNLIGTEQTHCSFNETFEFEASRGQVYILLADYTLSSGAQAQAFAAVTPTVTADLNQNVDLDSEVAFNLLTVTEHELNALKLDDITPLAANIDTLLDKADRLVARLNDFYIDRNSNRDADRFVDAVRNFTLDRLNLHSSVDIASLTHEMVRAYGGGLGDVRTMDLMLSEPKPPYNPHFIFERNTGDPTLNVTMSDMAANRWDYLFDDALGPHMATGGDKMVFTAWDGVTTNAGGYHVESLYLKRMGEDAREKLTPDWMHVNGARISPDQSKVVFSGYRVDINIAADTVGAAGLYSLWVVSIDSTDLIALTPERTYNDLVQLCPVASIPQGALKPDWSPSMQSIVFSTFRFDACNNSEVTESTLETINIDASARTTLLNILQLPGWFVARNPRWAPDGGEILFETFLGESDLELVAVSYPDVVDDQNNVTYWRYTDNDVRDVEGSYSYDGRFIIFCSDRNKDTDGAPTIPNFEIQPIYVLNRYTGDIFSNYGNFTNAGYYGNPLIVATEAVMVAVEGASTDSEGNVDIGISDNRTSSSSTGSTNNYYREIIPAANSMGMNFNVSSW